MSGPTQAGAAMNQLFARCAITCGPSTILSFKPKTTRKDYEEGARMNNACRAQGIAGSSDDFLICAVAYPCNWQIFTTDRDFSWYHKVLPLRLY